MNIARTLVMVSAAAAAGWFHPAAAAAQNSDRAYLVRTFELAEPELIDIRTSGGSIQVRGSEREEVRVEMYVRRNNRYLGETDTALEDFEIEIVQTDNTVRARAAREQQGRWRRFGGDSRISISFIVYTPRRTAVEARTSGGSITAENLEGEINLRTSGGSLALSGLKGQITARTSGGRISIDGTEGELAARTSGGSISATGSSGSLELRTSGGSIRMEEIGGSVSARTSGGSIRAKMFRVEEHVDLRTSGGSITVEIPGESGYEIDLRGSRVRTQLNRFSGEAGGKRVIGRIGDGGPVIRARTAGGTISINYL